MVSVCLPSDALSQHLPSYLGFSCLGRGLALYGCSSKAQPLLLTLDEEYLLVAAPPDLITVIQTYAPTSNAEEADVEWFYEDLQDFLEHPKKMSFSL